MQIAITTDWLTTFGGAEHVIREMQHLWPHAPLYTTVYAEGSLPGLQSPVHTSSLQKWYALTKNHRVLLPWMPRAVESWDLRDYDVILSSSHAVAKGCIPRSGAKHICYCHTPIRYAWEMEKQYLDDFNIPHWLRKPIRKELEKIRRWDLSTAKRVDVFIANSKTVQERIRRIYGRESVVLHPPVDQKFFLTPLQPRKKGTDLSIGQLSRQQSLFGAEDLEDTYEDYFLAVSRLVPYKRVDLLIEAANHMHFPLKIAGTGPEEEKLKKMAGPTVELLGYVTDEELMHLYSHATAFLFPAEEDAGIAPLEAQACGIPVIAFGKGGALDTVRENETGVFFPEQTVASLTDAMKRFQQLTFDPGTIRDHAVDFGAEQFRDKLKRIVERETATQNEQLF